MSDDQEYSDMVLVCRDCLEQFVWTAGEQQWFAERWTPGCTGGGSVPSARNPQIRKVGQLMVLQHRVDPLLDLGGQTIHSSGPCMPATVALHHDHRQALHDDHAGVVMALRTLDGERVVGVRHGRGETDPNAELAGEQCPVL